MDTRFALCALALLLAGCPSPAELCDGGDDEDGDGMVDCADSDCAADAACAGGDDDSSPADDDDGSPGPDDDDSSPGPDDDDSGADDDDSAQPPGYLFATNDPSEYVRVDRVGMPLVAATLIPPETRDAYNAAGPADDLAGVFTAAMGSVIDATNGALYDDAGALTLVPCAVLDGEDVVADACAAQVAASVIPDALPLSTALPQGFPNGRQLADPAPDIALAVLLLDLAIDEDPADGVPDQLGAFAAGPMNPAFNDAEFLSDFPYLAPPWEGAVE